MSRRLGYLLKKFPRLSETFVLNEILGQEECGREVIVFSRRPPDDEPRHPQLEQLRAEIVSLPRARELNPWKTLFNAESNGDLWNRLRKTSTHPILQRHPRFGDLMAEALHVLECTREAGVGHLHVHFATESAVVACLVHRLGGPSYSITAHAKDIYRSTVDSELLALIVEESTFTVTVCDANVAYLDALLPPSAMTQVRRLYNGVDLAAFRPDVAVREPHRILGVGRLVEKKGFDILMRAVAALLDSGRTVELVLAGQGDQEEALNALAGELQLGANLKFLGGVDQSIVRREMERATLLALPCRIGEDGNRDALPTVLLEALACGLPAISTPVSGVPEILAEGCGQIVPCDDVPSLTGALELWLDDPDLRSRIARAGRKHAEDHFERRSIAQTLNSWFQAALSEVEHCESPK